MIALHKNKGKSVAACLKSRTDYAQNPDKTQQGELVSSYECSPLTVDEEFMLSKRQYELMTGRRQKNDVIAYQIRQSFKPGEITAEEANKVGYELAMRFTKGKYAFIVATHTDREHIHNHIIYNSTALDSTRKFRDFLLSGLAVQRLSDLICLEHQLSVIEIKPYRERQKRTFYPPRESNRDKLCAVIDNILLNEKPTDFEAFLQTLEQQGYEIKRGKHTSVKGTRQKRFIRFRTLGAGYSEDEIKAVIAGEAEHRPHQKQPPKEQPFHLLVDIQAKLSEGKSEGYARWAKRYNLKEISKTLIFLQENKIGSIEEMQERVDAATARYHELGDSIKAAERRMAEIAVLRAHIINYAKTRPVYDAEWKIYCIRSAYYIYKNYGSDIYQEALKIIVEAWWGDSDSFLSGILHGVTRFVAMYRDEYSRERLIMRLGSVHPKTITKNARKDTGNIADRHMKQILEIYNGSSRSLSLPVKR